jgi:hypothetical protein
MANKTTAFWLTEEVADFLASSPSSSELMSYRPSAKASRRRAALLAKSTAGTLDATEQWELDQFEHVEMLMQSIKARLRSAKTVPV